MPVYQIVSGDAYLVEADNEDKAIEKYHAMLDNKACPCGRPEWGSQTPQEDGDELCDCVKEDECITVATLTDGGETIYEEILDALQDWANEPLSGKAGQEAFERNHRKARQEAFKMVLAIAYGSDDLDDDAA